MLTLFKDQPSGDLLTTEKTFTADAFAADEEENRIAFIKKTEYIGTMDEVKVKQNLNKAIEEQASRMRFAKDYSAYYDAKSREEEMQRLYEEISSLGEVMKSISMRIF